MTESEMHYKYHCETPSDIHEHLPVLREYALRCTSIAEFGVRTVVSTWALLHKGAKVFSYDIAYEPNVASCQAICAREGTHWDYRLENTRTALLPQDVDMIFFDSFHSYDQVKAELSQHAHRANRYLAFHDTVTFAVNGMGGEPGILPAIKEYMESHPEWSLVHDAKNNNGLMIFGKESI